MEDIKIIQLDESRWQEYKALRILAVTESPEAFSKTPAEEEKRTDEMWKSRLEKDVTKNMFRMYFAESAGKLVCMININFHRDEKIKHIGEIGSVYVIPEFRGKGISKKLLEEAISFAKQEVKIRKVVLEVTVTQIAAVSLYEKLGFRNVGVLKDELKVGDQYLDHIYMEKLLY